jgi:hypothetical protein
LAIPNLHDWLLEQSDEDTDDDATLEVEMVWLEKLPLGGAGEGETRRSTHATT